MPQQQASMGPALIEGVERTSVVMVCSNQRAWFAQQNLYAMEVDRSNRNCYSCEGFGYLARNCRNRRTENRIGKKIRLKYGQKNLNGEEYLVVLD